MAFTQETIDFSQLSENKIKTKLSELNIPLTTETALRSTHLPSVALGERKESTLTLRVAGEVFCTLRTIL